jgi:ribonuclease HI
MNLRNNNTEYYYGIKTPRDEVKKLVEGYSGAKFRGYLSLEEAEEDWFSYQKENTDNLKSSENKKLNNNSKTDNMSPDILLNDYDLLIYTDGACEGNPGLAGSGLAIYGMPNQVKPQLLTGCFTQKGTNNSAELNAFLKALQLSEEYIKNNKDYSICILADSQYTINCITNWAYGWQNNGWKKKSHGEIKNLELIKEAFYIYEDIKNNIMVKHVKGHSGNEGNELADRMAVQAIVQKKEDFYIFEYDTVENILGLKSF